MSQNSNTALEYMPTANPLDSIRQTKAAGQETSFTDDRTLQCHNPNEA